MSKFRTLLLVITVSTMGITGMAAAATPHFLHGPVTTSVHKMDTLSIAKATPEDVSGMHFVPSTPSRIFDTRAQGGPVPAGHALGAGLHDLDPRVSAVVVNLTVTNPTQNTYVTAYDANARGPVGSSINVRAHETRANQVTVPLVRGGDDSGGFFIYNNTGTVDMIGDISGYYLTGNAQQGEAFDGYQPSSAPQRLMDTRSSGGPIPGGHANKLDLSHSVSADTNAVTVNLTAIANTTGGFLTLYPGDGARSSSSSINVNAGETTPNLVTVRLGADKSLGIYNSAGNTDAIIDLIGSYGPSATALYYPAYPEYPVDHHRILDTSNGALRPGQEITVTVPDPPANTVAVNTNVTGVNPSKATFITTWPSGDRPATSNLNLAAGHTAANADVIPIAGAAFQLYNNAGNADAIVDVTGYFAN